MLLVLTEKSVLARSGICDYIQKNVISLLINVEIFAKGIHLVF